MNRYHHVIWNAIRGQWVVVGELAKTKVKARRATRKTPLSPCRPRLTTTLLGLLIVNSASAGTWLHPASGSWSDTSFWSDGAVPDATTFAVINNGGSAIITSENPFAYELQINNNSSVIIDGTATALLGTPTTLRILDRLELNSGNLIVRHGGVANIPSMLNALGENTISVQYSGSELKLNQNETNINSNGGMTLSIRNGGVVDSKINTLGNLANQSGTVIVDGSDPFDGTTSHWKTMGIEVGSLGDGTLTVSREARVSTETNYDVKIGRDLSDISQHDLDFYGAGALDPDAANTVNSLNIGAAAGGTPVRPGSVNTESIVFGQGTNSLVFNHSSSNFEFGPDIIIDHRLLPLPRIDFFAGTTTLTGNVLSRGSDVFGNPMDFLGDIIIHNKAELSIGNGSGTGWIDGDITNNGTLTFHHPHNRTYEHSLSGVGTLVKGGDNRLALTARVNNTGDVNVNAGTLTVTRGSKVDEINDSTLNSANGSIGDVANSDGNVNVSGVNAIWSIDANLIVGHFGTGNLSINDAGTTINTLAVIGDKAGSTGSATVSGEGSTWNNLGDLFVGNESSGELTITDSGVVAAVGGLIGADAAVTGVVNVDGAGSRLNSNSLVIGSNGQGSLNLTNGGRANVSGQVTIGLNAGSNGVLNIGAAVGESPIAAGTLSAGSMQFGSGSGKLIFNHTNNITFSESVSGGGSVDLYAGTTRFTEFQTYTGDTTIHGGKLIIGAPGSRGSIAGNIINNGSLDFSRSTSHTHTGNINGSGSITLNNNLQTLTVTGNLTHEGGTTISNGQLNVGNGGTSGSLAGNVSIASGATLAFNRSDNISFAGNVAGNGYGNLIKRNIGTLNLTGSSDVQTFTIDNGAVTLNNGGSVKSRTGIIADAGGTSHMTVDGAGSRWDAYEINVGTMNTGALTISNGGSVNVTVDNFQTHFLKGDVFLGTSSASGTLNIGAAASDSAIAAGNLTAVRVTLQSDASHIVFNHTNTNYDFASNIAGDGSIDLYSGTTTLSGNNTYSGNTTVNGGTLNVNNVTGSATGNSSVSIAGGASLTGSGHIAGDVIIASGGHLAAGNSPGNLTLGELLLNNASVLDFELDAPSGTAGIDNDLITVTGDLTLDGILNITDLGGFDFASDLGDSGTYRLFNYAGTLVDNAMEFGAGLLTGYSYRIDTSTPGVISLVAGFAGLQFWDGNNTIADNTVAGGNGTWSSSASNWTNQSGDVNSTWGSLVAVFGGATGTVEVDGTHTVSGLQFATDGYRIQDANANGGLMLANNGAEIRVDSDTGAAINLTVSGDGRLTKTGAGTLSLIRSNTYNGGTHINAGTLVIGNDDALGTGLLTIGDGTTLATDGDPRRIHNDIAANGDFSLFPHGTIVNTSAFELDSNINLQGGDRTITNTSDFNAFDFGQVTLGGVISSGGLVLSDKGLAPGGNVVFFAMDGTQANTYTGNTVVKSNVSLQLSKSANVTAIAGDVAIQQESIVVVANDEQIADTSNLTFTGNAQLQVGVGAAATETVSTISDDGNGMALIDLHGNGSAIAVSSGNFSGSIQGGQANTTSLTKNGSETLALNGASTYTGDTTVNSGALLINNLTGSATGTGSVTLVSGSRLSGDGTITGSVRVDDNATIAAGNSPGTLTVGELLLNNASILEFELSSPAGTAGVDSDLIVVSGNLTLDGTLEIIDWGGYGAGTYRLITYTGTFVDNGLDISSQPSDFNAALDTTNPGEINLVVTNEVTSTPHALPTFGLPGLGLLALLLSLTGMRLFPREKR
ncbi:autotransporter-associated beta strand repeat-containing protein [Gilvimarinus agarilyticus]|uniref:autotransporter-associated beta strand repeat-containing protein n=1 Tax=Gilvimarinus sp. 2_MG-2023 TaxID=3062666 RepID=UPI001C0891E3|nr:autotransporter-associated beta strand repeat-containing protein [Gilvimarinus sp. 2_MG-2023]MBU2885360.1 autotransporter-associated beta strand repeat-containing protein [Gilvimarinus agarilyticus]MDO6570259.1 autotransporter-associated beta strand repeat-containing protein [Gilvimarinus sp. 2_MG-2023]